MAMGILMTTSPTVKTTAMASPVRKNFRCCQWNRCRSSMRSLPLWSSDASSRRSET